MGGKILSKLDKLYTRVNAVIEGIIGETKEVGALYEAARHLIKAGGKRLRPFIVVKSCEAVGGEGSSALLVAAGIELLHTFTLIHDDLMDDDNVRRGVSTVHKVWGAPIAITAGDLLFAKVYESITRYFEAQRVPKETVLKILREVTGSIVRVCEGQVLDISFERRLDLTERDYFNVIEAKTAALFEISAQTGGIIGGGTEKQVKGLGEYGFSAGVAFQLTDDVLGLTAKEGVLGKPVGSDVREGKMTLIMIHALSKCDPDQRAMVVRALGNKQASADEIAEAIEVVKSLGSIDYVLNKARSYVEKAKRSLDGLPSSEARSDLITLADFFTTRKY